MGSASMIKTALVHDWLFSLSGAEKTLEAIYSLFPSPIYTLIHNEKNFGTTHFSNACIKTSFIQRLPFGKKLYPYYLPLFPLAIERHDLSQYDLIISSSSSVAKNILTHSEQIHICYCHTPMRYIWDLYYDYLSLYKLNHGMKGLLAQTFFQKLRSWDFCASQRVDHFIANSHSVAKRIYKLYGKKAEVIYPPVDVTYFMEKEEIKEQFYLTAARLVPYKKVDIIVEAFSAMPEKKLLVCGEGPMLPALKKIAKKNIFFLGHVNDETLRSLLHKAKGFVYMAHEDFGILPVEAQACKTPVIAYGKGGCLETVVDKKTGLLFKSQTAASLIEAISLFEKTQDLFEPEALKKHSMQFSKERFLLEFNEAIQNVSRNDS